MTTTRYVLIDKAAATARTSPNTIRYWIQIGRLRSTRPGRRRPDRGARPDRAHRGAV
jgi:hypothetical protein